MVSLEQHIRRVSLAGRAPVAGQGLQITEKKVLPL